MTIFHCEGFETVGDMSSSGADVQTRLAAIDSGGDGSTAFVVTSGGFAGDVTLISDFDAVGLALQFPSIDASRAEYVQFEWPDGTGRFSDYKLSTNGSIPVFVTGWRLFNAETDPAQVVTLWSILQGSGSAMSSLTRAANGTDLVFVPASGGNTTISSVLSVNTWHYIELEYKATSSANGGYIKVFVDGSEVADLTSQNVASATFFTTYGDRIGVAGASNEASGNQFAIDDIYHLEMDGVDHSAPLGPVRVLLLSPNSDATPNDWTPSTGSDNFDLIDEQDWDTSDYVDATTTGDDDHYGLTTLGAVTAVHGIQVDVACIAIDGTPTLHIGTHDGTNSDEESMGVIGTSSTVQKRMFFEVDPAGGAWSEADVNSVEVTQRMTE